jgi:hypothetical protein
MSSKLPRRLWLEPFDHPITPAEQEDITPDMVFPALTIIGKLPAIVSQWLGRPEQDFYFQRDGNKICLTRNNTPVLPPTPDQVAQRYLFAQAVAAWQALSPTEKDAWNNDQRRHDFNLPGYQFFLREFLRGRI